MGESQAPEAPTFSALGLAIDALDLRRAADRVEEWLASGRRSYVCHANVHGVMEAHGDPRVAAAYAGAGLRVADGMPLVWLGRRAGHPDVGRVYGPDFMLEICARASARGYSCFYLGGGPGVAGALAEAMATRFPGLRTAGSWTPPPGVDGTRVDGEAVERVNAAGADIVWVGLGCPRQELWMATHRPVLRAGVLIGVGAAFDFHTGRVRQAPAWMQRSGLEWLYRLVQEPRRLWRRYVVTNTLFLAHVALQLTGLKRYGSRSA